MLIFVVIEPILEFINLFNYPLPLLYVCSSLVMGLTCIGFSLSPYSLVSSLNLVVISLLVCPIYGYLIDSAFLGVILGVLTFPNRVFS